MRADVIVLPEPCVDDDLGLLGRRGSTGEGASGRIDAEHMPAYLESSSPNNNHRYESVGFVAAASFQVPGDGPIVTGMWRSRR
jgi:hypothetical protein